MKNLFTALILGTSLALAACGENPDEISAADSKSQSKSAGKAAFRVSITGLEASGKDCIVGIKLKNTTGQDVRLFQFIKYTALYKGGEFSDNGSYYKLKNGESTTRAGVMVMGVACSDVQKIRIDEMKCNFERDPKTMLNPSCAQNVVLTGNKQIKLTLKQAN